MSLTVVKIQQGWNRLVELKDFPRDLAYDKTNEEQGEPLIKYLNEYEYSPFKNSTLADIFLYAMALGYHFKDKEPLKKPVRNIPSNALGEHGEWLIISLAVKEMGDLSVLKDFKKIVNIAEEYANGGLKYLLEIIKSSALDADSEKKLEDEMRKVFAKIKQNKITKVETDVENLLKKEENNTLEFKSSMLWDYKLNQVNKKLYEPILKTIVAFMNTNGGTLFVGIDDNHNIIGLENDFKCLGTRNNWDGWEQTLVNHINEKIGKEYHEFIRIERIEYRDKSIAKIVVKPSNKPVFLYPKTNPEFYIRAGNTSQLLNNIETLNYINNHFGDRYV